MQERTATTTTIACLSLHYLNKVLPEELHEQNITYIPSNPRYFEHLNLEPKSPRHLQLCKILGSEMNILLQSLSETSTYLRLYCNKTFVATLLINSKKEKCNNIEFSQISEIY